MIRRACRPPNPNPLAPSEKVGQREIDLDIVILVMLVCATITLLIELVVFTSLQILSKDHAGLDPILAWTFVCWFINLVAVYFRISSASETWSL